MKLNFIQVAISVSSYRRYIYDSELADDQEEASPAADKSVDQKPAKRAESDGSSSSGEGTPYGIINMTKMSWSIHVLG